MHRRHLYLAVVTALVLAGLVPPAQAADPRPSGLAAWEPTVRQAIDTTTIDAALAAASLSPGADVDVYAARVVDGLRGPAYVTYEGGGGAFDQNFWPASSVKVLAAVAALEYAESLGFDGGATLTFDDGFSSTLQGIYDPALRISANDNYDRLLQVVGLDRFNNEFLTAANGFPTTIIERGYSGLDVADSPGITFTEDGRSRYVPPRSSSGFYGCGGNCADLFELNEVVRRLMLDEELPAAERFAIAARDLAGVRDALLGADGFVEQAAAATLGPAVEVFKKPGWVPGLACVDTAYIDDPASGARYLFAASTPADGGDCSRLGSIASVVLATLREAGSGPGAAVAPDVETGVTVGRPAEEVSTGSGCGLLLDIAATSATSADRIDVLVDGTALDRIPGPSGRVVIEPAPVAGQLLSVRAERGPDEVGYWSQRISTGGCLAGTVGGGSTSTGIAAPSTSFYFADGTVRPGFAEYLTLSNPMTATAAVVVRFQASDDGGQPVAVPDLSETVAGGQRVTVDVSDWVAGRGAEPPLNLAMAVTADQPIVAERPLYFRADPGLGTAIAGGSSVVGAVAPATSFFFAEGTVRPGFVEYLTVANPLTETAHVTVAFQAAADDGARVRVPALVKEVAAGARVTLDISRWVAAAGITTPVDLAMSVSSDQPVVAERPLYFLADPGVGATIGGGSTSTGVTAPATSFYLAEGTVRPGFAEYLTIANPLTETARVTVVFQAADDGGQAVAVPRLVTEVRPGSRATVDVSEWVARSGVTAPVNLAMTVASDQPVVAERPLYFLADPGLGVAIGGGSTSAGVTSPSTSFYFAEGTVRAGFAEYLTLANPGPATVAVVVTFQAADDGGVPVAVPVLHQEAGPGSRVTVSIAPWLAHAGAGGPLNVAMAVTADDPIVAERPLYFAFRPF